MIIRYAIAYAKLEERTMAYRLYVADALYYSQRGVAMPMRYMDILDNKSATAGGESAPAAPVETGEQTIDRLKRKMRGETA